MASTMATTIDPLLFGNSAQQAFGVRHQRPSQATFRRRRRTVGAVVVFALASGFITTSAFASNPSDGQVVPRTVVVQSGDTIWSIARNIAPTGGIADLVAELVRLNGTHLEPGQVVRIP